MGWIIRLWVILGILFVSIISFGQKDVFEPLTEELIINDAVGDAESSYMCSNCNECSGEGMLFSLPFNEFPFVLISIAIIILLVFKRKRKIILFWVLGVLLFAGIIFKVAQESDYRGEDFYGTGEFVTTSDSNYVTIRDNDSIVTSLYEVDTDLSLKNASEIDDFSELEEFETFDEGVSPTVEGGFSEGDKHNLLRTCIALMATFFAGLLFRYKRIYAIRSLLLLSSLVYLGFISGGCPCMISSFQNLILLLLGDSVNRLNLIWIFGLLLLTYFFGKIWCGWVCHLGALQEFIYRSKRAKKGLKPQVQKVLKVIRVVAIIALVMQIVFTRTNLYIKIDPFRVVFNLFSSNVTGYILLGILLLSSLFIYRPFCKTLCPVGLILGWVSRIPGAYKLTVNQNCKSCSRCEKDCAYGAVSNVNKRFVINEECIQCGDCLDVCSFKAINK
ncbi:4Fe-4S binding protein [Plebeiibacterium marinum]|uniref:4Fe-4S binding protein n=1 Tax=Plebeiibacterium marinum TaxID=2992111 RepID=A0AAE3MBU8_9BACT|nr:4Fe-4S binding protein [Plebeiobacterium marinum]MCW3804911.1 4Fe-4S binding protein [Plebeiobacterium marinum]